MVIIWFFDIGPIVIGIFLLFFGLVGKLMEALPVIETIYWILYAILCIGALWLLFSDEYPSKGYRIGHGITLTGCLLFMGIISNQFFRSIVAAYGEGDLNGFFNLVFTVIGNGFVWFFGFLAATYVAIILPLKEGETMTAPRMVLSVLATVGLLFLSLR